MFLMDIAPASSHSGWSLFAGLIKKEPFRRIQGPCHGVAPRAVLIQITITACISQGRVVCHCLSVYSEPRR